MLGAIVGSFLATILIRWPQGQGAMAGRSRCDGCARTLGAGELVPLLSFALLRGRCRSCGTRIDWRSPAMELAAGLIGVAAVLAHPLPMALATAVFGWFLLVLAALDAEHQWLPDVLTLPLIPLGLGAGFLGFGPPLLDRVIGAVAGLAALWLLGFVYQRVRGREGLGGGDPKLLAGIGAWVGVLALPFVLLGAGVIGLLAVLVMRVRGARIDGATRVPLGALMAAAAWPAWLAGDVLISLAL